MARVGAQVYHAGCLGEDGEFLAEVLTENHVDTSYLKRVKEKNGHAIIQVTASGENAIFIHPGSNGMVTKEDIDSTLSDFDRGDIVLLQNEISNVDYIIDQAYRQGLCIILNPSPMNDVIKRVDLCKISYLVLNEIEAKMISRCDDTLTALEYFRLEFPSLSVILTLGSHGSIYQDAKEKIFQPSFEVETKDTTAAGDTFTGYFVAATVNGIALKEALEIASCAAAIAVSRAGAAPSIPKHDEVMAALKVLKPKENNLTFKMLKESIRQYIDSNLATICLADIADMLGYSLVYTGVLIKRLMGISFQKYLLERRLSHAAELLVNTQLPIREIIAKTGYENESYFRKKFAERYGQKPLAYRKNCGNPQGKRCPK